MLSPKQAASVSVEDLSRLILEELQKREGMTSQQLQLHTSYYPWDLNGIEGDIFSIRYDAEGMEYVSYEARQRFEAKFAQAKQSLYRSDFIYRDPTQDADDFARLTDKGKKIDLRAPIFGVTSTDDFIKVIRGEGSPLDPVVEGYLRESYSAAEAELWLSATFMLGAASERLLFVAAHRVDDLLKNSAESSKLKKLWKVREVKEWIVGHLTTLRKTYPAHRDAFTDVEDVFDTLFTLYRYQRNEAGHPTEKMPNLDPAKIRSMLLSFGTFNARVGAILAVQP